MKIYSNGSYINISDEDGSYVQIDKSRLGNYCIYVQAAYKYNNNPGNMSQDEFEKLFQVMKIARNVLKNIEQEKDPHLEGGSFPLISGR